MNPPPSHLLTDKTLVVIPALDEADSIGQVILSLQEEGFRNIRVVDNGSEDATAEVAQAAGADVVHEPVRGYGRACWRGLEDIPETIEWILFCDADGSDDLSALPEFVRLAPESDLLLSDRSATPEGRRHLTPPQRFGSRLAGLLIGRIWGQSFRDLGPLRLIRRSALEQIDMKDRGFGWTVEMQARAAALGLRCREIPTGYHPRRSGQSKIAGNIKGSLQAGVIILWTLLKLWLQRPTRYSILGALILAVGAFSLVPHSDLHQAGVVPDFLLAATLLSAGWVLSQRASTITGRTFWISAIGLRLILLAAIPGDDIWRYLWEGHIQTLGFSPYHLAPDSEMLKAHRTEFWELINHPQLATVYPPVAEFIFRIMASLSLSVLAFKGLFVAADLLICRLLARKFGYRAAILFAWNPVVLYSFAAGGHYDSLFLLPLAAAWLLPSWYRPRSYRQQLLIQSLLVGLSIAIKWMSAPAALWLAWNAYRRAGWKEAALSATAAALPTIAGAAFYLWGHGPPSFPAEFANVARSTEFIPWFVQQIWPWSYRHNWLFGIPLALFCCYGLRRRMPLGNYLEGYFILLLLCAPLFHHWYASWPILFAVASRNLGIRLFSISSFLYFLQVHRYTLTGDIDPGAWNLEFGERMALWLPLLFGGLYSWLRPNSALQRPTLVMMLKEPRPGMVKTRLARDVGADKACAIYRELAVGQLARVPASWNVDIASDPPASLTAMRQWLGNRARYFPQAPGSLGDRLRDALQQPRDHSGPVFFAGGDCPKLDGPLLRKAAEQLQQHDIVIIPAHDGGYVLIGMNAPCTALFDGIDWSTNRVCQQTLERAKAWHLSVAQLDPLEDVDDLASWERSLK
jgi:rSAM/selenodomain-associated transferase 1